MPARHAEDREDRVAHHPVDDPAVPLDLLGQPAERPGDQRLDDLGASRSPSEVDPTRSANRAAANFRSRTGAAAAAPPSAVPRARQNRATSGFSVPHAPHTLPIVAGV